MGNVLRPLDLMHLYCKRHFIPETGEVRYLYFCFKITDISESSKLMLVTLQSQQTFLVDLRKGTRSRTELVDTQAQQLSPNQDR